MKCLLVADIHYSLKQFDWIQAVAGQFDLVVIAGDLLDLASLVTKEAQIIVVLSYLRRIAPQAQLLVSSGNHDGNTVTATDEPVARWLAKAAKAGAIVDGESAVRSDYLFTVCPWRAGPESTERVLQQLVTDSQKSRKKWIWIYHEPPQGRPVSWNGKSHTGDKQVLEWIERFQPDLVMSGHVHQAPFRNNGSWIDRVGATWVFNMGRQIGPMPCLIDIDFENGTATWVSQAGQESVDLSKPLPLPG